MKISKTLLQAILVGVTIGTATTSCDTIKKDNELQLKIDTDEALRPHNPEAQYYENCPACGLG